MLKAEEKDGNQPRLDHDTTVQSLGEPSEIGKSTHLVHVTTVKAVETHEERVVRVSHNVFPLKSSLAYVENSFAFPRNFCYSFHFKLLRYSLKQVK